MRSSGINLRIKALLWDYICIALYLIILAIVMIAIYFTAFHEIPKFKESQSQVIAFLTTILPVTAYFSRRESREPFSTFGKNKVGIKVKYHKNSVISSIIRNIFKFLPWQCAHMAIIRGIYRGFDSIFVFIFYFLSIILPIIYIGMVWLRADHKHIPDLLASSQVIIVEDKEY